MIFAAKKKTTHMLLFRSRHFGRTLTKVTYGKYATRVPDPLDEKTDLLKFAS